MMGGFGGSMGGIANAGKSKRPINVKFEIPYFTTSGIQVRYLKIIEPKVRLFAAPIPTRQFAWNRQEKSRCTYNADSSMRVADLIHVV